jgi:hypothetical protein
VDHSLRQENCAAKVLQMREVMPGIAPEDAADLLPTVVTLCDASVVRAQLDGLIAGTDPGRAERRRAAVVRTVRAAAEALLPAPGGGTSVRGERKGGRPISGTATFSVLSAWNLEGMHPQGQRGN